jgi:hypothetical protein
VQTFVSGGTAPYNYTWENATTSQIVSTQAGPINLSNGNYFLTVQDNFNCEDSISVQITHPSAIQLVSSQVINVGCFGENTGSINIELSGGMLPYSYIWTNGSLTQDLSGLISGAYGVTIYDSNNCQLLANFNITQPSSPINIAIISVQDVACNGFSTGQIVVGFIGGNVGTQPYSYSWSGPTVNNDTLNNAPAGYYSVTITDSLGCSNTIDSIQITAPSQPLVVDSVAIENVLCYSENQGSIEVFVLGGNQPYSYNWTGPGGFIPPTDSISNLIAGTFSVLITDSSGCSINTSYVINEPNSIILTESHSNLLCDSTSSGGINLSVNGGTQPYTYQWTTSGGVIPQGQINQQDIYFLPGGTYNVSVTDNNNCIDSLQITILQPSSQLSASFQPTDVNCFGDTSGVILVTVSGGSGPYDVS